ncbi:MAG: diacylglycerol kinase family protein [Candidatus Zambryskibacteria bacterium]|nr:diacylglycerol kinase family protein [Candidatus Zambryskibacteria bacterium]
MLQKSINSFLCAYRGLKTTWVEERNFRIEVFAFTVVTFFIIYFKFSFVETAFCVLAMTLVLSAEIVNTAIEDLCNFVEPEHNYIIGKIKDTMGGFVFVTVLGAITIGILVFYTHFF